MDIETKMRGAEVEVQFTDCFLVKDFEAVVKIAAALSLLRNTHAIKPTPEIAGGRLKSPASL